MMTNKNLKFLFHRLGRNERLSEKIRQTNTLEDELGLLELHRKNWQDFVEKMLTKTKDPNFDNYNKSNSEKELIKNVLENAKICQKLCMYIYDFCAESFKEYLLGNLSHIMESITKGMLLNWQRNKYEVEKPEFMRYFGLYYFQDGIFPTCNEDIKKLKAKTPNSVEVA